MTASNVVLPATGQGTAIPNVAVDLIVGSAYQRIKSIDPTVDSTAAIGVAANPWRVAATGLGETTDVKVVTDTNGSAVAFLRGIISQLADIIENKAQTPAKTKMLNVQIGPGDVISNLPVTIDYAHHQIHEGEAHIWCNYTAALNGTKNIRIFIPVLTATTRTPHMVMEVVADAAALIYLYEGTTWTSGGTDNSTSIFNKIRNSITASGTKIYLTGATALTVNAAGTLIYRGMLIAAAKAAMVSDVSRDEWCLASNTEYNLQIVTTGAAAVMVRLHFYEDLGV
jgi:hypothetical protein